MRPRRGGDFLLAKNTTLTLDNALFPHNVKKVERSQPFRLVCFLRVGVKGVCPLANIIYALHKCSEYIKPSFLSFDCSCFSTFLNCKKIKKGGFMYG